MKYTLIGGTPIREIESLTIEGILPITDTQLEENLRYARGLCLPRLEGIARKPLAVVGGGGSIKSSLGELRAFEGDIFAINGAFGFLKENGIASTFLAVDPHPIVAKWAQGAEKAILATQCPPEAFDVLKDADVRVFEAGTEIKSGGSTASSTPWLAAKLGYSSLTLYGCECSFEHNTHAYQHEVRQDLMIVESGDNDYLTASDFYRFAQELTAIHKGLNTLVPGWFKEKSGGLLRAMIERETYRIKWISEEMAKGLRV